MADAVIEGLSNASGPSSSQTSKNDSTPKRAEPRHTLKDPVACASHYGRSPGAQKPLAKRGHSQRTILQPISPNRRHTMGASVVQQKGDAGIRQSLPSDDHRGMQGIKRGNDEAGLDTDTSSPLE